MRPVAEVAMYFVSEEVANFAVEETAARDCAVVMRLNSRRLQLDVVAWFFQARLGCVLACSPCSVVYVLWKLEKKK